MKNNHDPKACASVLRAMLEAGPDHLDFESLRENLLPLLDGIESPMRKKELADIHHPQTSELICSGKDYTERVIAACGCEGRHDCQCVSVHNQVATEIWTQYNQRQSGPAH